MGVPLDKHLCMSDAFLQSSVLTPLFNHESELIGKTQHLKKTTNLMLITKAATIRKRPRHQKTKWPTRNIDRNPLNPSQNEPVYERMDSTSIKK